MLAVSRNVVFNDLKPGHIVRQIVEKVTVTILHVVLKFQFDRARFQKREEIENFGGKMK